MPWAVLSTPSKARSECSALKWFACTQVIVIGNGTSPDRPARSLCDLCHLIRSIYQIVFARRQPKMRLRSARPSAQPRHRHPDPSCLLASYLMWPHGVARNTGASSSHQRNASKAKIILISIYLKCLLVWAQNYYFNLDIRGRQCLGAFHSVRGNEHNWQTVTGSINNQVWYCSRAFGNAFW